MTSNEDAAFGVVMSEMKMSGERSCGCELVTKRQLHI
jgi:hypothetical protein